MNHVVCQIFMQLNPDYKCIANECEINYHFFVMFMRFFRYLDIR